METPTNNAPKLVTVPEDALLSLLEKAGQNPVEFFDLQSARVISGKAFQKRANAARWSILWLGLSTLFSASSLLTSFNTEDIIATVLLGAMTITEFKVRGWFLTGNAKGARYR